MLPSETQILLQREKPRGRGGEKSPSNKANFKYDSTDISVGILNTVQCLPL